LTSSAQTERDFWQSSTKATTVTDENDGALRVIRCPLRPLPGGRPSLLAWRKLMVLLSMLPGDQSRLLLRMAHQVPAVPDLEPSLYRLERAFDLVHAFNLSWEYPLTAGWRFARQQDKPLVVTPYTHFGVAGHDRVARNSTMDHQRKILTGAEAVLTLTTIEEAGLARLGVPPGRITTIHGGLDPLPTFPDPAALITRFQLPNSFVLFVGRASHDKGAIHAAQAVNRLNRENQPLTLVMAGQSTPEFDNFYRLLSSQEQSAIRHLGLVTESEKHGLLALAEMLLLPSRIDSFGIVLLEAWAHGRPVIGARAGGIPAVIDDGQNGLLVDFGDVPALAQAIQHLLETPGRKTTLGRAGLEKVNRIYRWEFVGDRVEDSYHQALTQFGESGSK
jgi:glycosyltransferase involved in cell wall biosynthesis